MIILVIGMSSRMEKYYDDASTANKRSERNATLYKKMYDDEIYSNIEGVVTTPKTNEIDIEKIREVLLRREQQENSKNQLVKRDIEVEMPDMNFFDDEDKNYDITDILKQAKEESESSRENKYRSLDSEYIKELKNPVKKIEKIPTENDIQEIKELMNTIANSKDLAKLKDTDLSLGMFSDLKANTGTLNSEDPIIKAIINEAREMEERNSLTKEQENIDKTFDTKGMKLKAKDYVKKTEDLDSDNDKNPILTIFMVILFLILAGLIVYILYTVLK